MAWFPDIETFSDGRLEVTLNYNVKKLAQSPGDYARKMYHEATIEIENEQYRRSMRDNANMTVGFPPHGAGANDDHMFVLKSNAEIMVNQEPGRIEVYKPPQEPSWRRIAKWIDNKQLLKEMDDNYLKNAGAYCQRKIHEVDLGLGQTLSGDVWLTKRRARLDVVRQNVIREQQYRINHDVGKEVTKVKPVEVKVPTLKGLLEQQCTAQMPAKKAVQMAFGRRGR